MRSGMPVTISHCVGSPIPRLLEPLALCSSSEARSVLFGGKDPQVVSAYWFGNRHLVGLPLPLVLAQVLGPRIQNVVIFLVDLYQNGHLVPLPQLICHPRNKILPVVQNMDRKLTENSIHKGFQCPILVLIVISHRF